VAKVRNITKEDLWVPLLGQVVRPDEVVDVPDPEPHLTGELDGKGRPVTRTPDLDEVWNPDTWAAVGGPAKKKDDD
jgi:hypothetical protein